MRLTVVVAFLLSLFSASLSAHAQARDPVRTQAVQFPAGKTGTVIRGAIKGRGSALYTVGAEAGQTMKVRLKPSNAATYFNIYQPGRGPGDEAFVIGETQPVLNSFEGKLPTSGTYSISVFMMRSAARRNERSSYTLDIQVSALADVNAPVQADFADGLQGGPDFWEVVGVPKGDRLNMREGPSAAEPIVTRLSNGAVLRNMGCRMNGGQRWCKVERRGAPADTGWVAGRYLREGG
jgi:hypothetical protein